MRLILVDINITRSTKNLLKIELVLVYMSKRVVEDSVSHVSRATIAHSRMPRFQIL